MNEKNSMSNIDIPIWKYLTGNATTGEYDELMLWLEESEENRSYFVKQKMAWMALDESLQQSHTERWEQLHNRLSSRQLENTITARPTQGLRRVLSWKWQYAASIIFIIGIAIALKVGYKPRVPVELAQNVFEVPYGSQSTLVLPDGSKLWINSGSKLTYNRDFGKTNRDIYLTGEAYFDVAKNPKLPFIVHARNLKIKAIGTAFNVKAYPEEKRIETTLVKGLVQIEKEGVQKAVFLHPKEKVVFTEETKAPNNTITTNESLKTETLVKADSVFENVLLTKAVNTEKEISWKDRKLLFDREPLSLLVIKLERKYNVQFSFKDEKLKDYQFTGVFNDISLEQILEAMKLSSPIDFEINENLVLLKTKSLNKN